MFQLSDFDYVLPKELIAQQALPDRGCARLLVLNKATGEIKHSAFHQCVDYFEKGDVLVLNNTKVLPARFFAKKETGGVVEVLLLKEISRGRPPRLPVISGRPQGVAPTFKNPRNGRYDGEVWEALLRPSGRVKEGQTILFSSFTAHVLDSPRQNSGIRQIAFEKGVNVREQMEKIGRVPLPPYIDREDLPIDRELYQTIYARIPGSVASPTAGLHFDEPLLYQLERKGVEIVFITLHVGYGTFQPVAEEELSRHKMHPEYFEIPEESAEKINMAKSDGRRIVACGTTSVRTLEAAISQKGDRFARHKAGEVCLKNRTECFVDGSRRDSWRRTKNLSPFLLKAMRGATDLFISPPYEFKIADAIITNFHLPRTTLLMLVAAFSGKENLDRAYQEAIQQKYRFYSYGDAMLVI
ncbi:MAG: S-adenosylmethionine:tRNA ribosyltransferase-isomerase [Candidatus Omnitrophica bacterium]|nr:S-adenosylmethionine:tRNA ribosyltransferase-isomerase [Candidatus Omnitrophota bacterium]